MNDSNVIVDARLEKRERPAALQGSGMQELLRGAIERGQLDVARDIMAMIREERDAQARMAYTAAMAKFKADPPQIVKDKLVSYTTDKGLKEYKHATLGAVCAAIIEGLSRVGISHRWQTEQKSGLIGVTCILTHEAGHSESVHLEGPPDPSGSKNAIQAIGSTITYLERYSLLAVAGIGAQEDDDGNHPQQREANKPADYDQWVAHMEAKVAQGTAELQKAWRASAAELRIFASADRDWWAGVKARAAQVKP